MSEHSIIFQLVDFLLMILSNQVEKSVDDLPSLPRLDAQECMKRCICEAHNQPKKYGLVGLGLQLFFP